MLSRKVITIIIIGILLLISFGLLYFYNIKTNTNIFSSKKDVINKKINFGMEIWPGYLLVPLAEKLGYFREEGLDVKVTVYKGIEPLEADILSGKIDARAAFASDVVDYLDINKRPEQIVLITDYSSGGDGMIAKDSVPNIRVAKKPKISFSGDIDFFALWILKKLNLDFNSVEFVFANSEEESLKNYMSGKADYIITYDPYLSQARNSGGRYEYSSDEDPGVITDVIAFQKTYIQDNEEAVDSFVRAYFRAYDYWLSNRDESYVLVKDEIGLSVDEFSLQMNSLKMVDLYNNSLAMNISAGLKSIYGNLRIINLFMNEFDNKYGIHNTDEYIYSSSIKALNKQNKAI